MASLASKRCGVLNILEKKWAIEFSICSAKWLQYFLLYQIPSDFVEG